MGKFMGALLLIGLVGCGAMFGDITIGNPELKQFQPEHIKGLTKAQVIARYGAPTSKQVMFRDGQSFESLTWSYAHVEAGHVESAGFTVSFDDKGMVSIISQNQ